MQEWLTRYAPRARVLALVCLAACSGPRDARCGPGTELRDGVCTVAESGDAGMEQPAADGGPTREPYDAYSNAGGPLCGTNAAGTYVYCQPGDDCIDPVDDRCAPSEDGTYEAYYGASGPLCGTNAAGTYVYCQPGDSCLDAETRRCS